MTRDQMVAKISKYQGWKTSPVDPEDLANFINCFGGDANCSDKRIYGMDLSGIKMSHLRLICKFIDAALHLAAVLGEVDAAARVSYEKNHPEEFGDEK